MTFDNIAKIFGTLLILFIYKESALDKKRYKNEYKGAKGIKKKIKGN